MGWMGQNRQNGKSTPTTRAKLAWADYSRVLALALVYSAVAGPAYAYIDPGTGTLLLQLLIAAIATGLATVKLWYYKVVSLFRPTPPEAESEEAKSEDS